jgi:hypothetical protein
VDLGEAEGLEGIDELTELADVGEGLCMPYRCQEKLS